jgi:hypothetical protein
MMGRRSFLSLAATLWGAFGLADCDMPKKQTWAVRYRLTLDVETPDGVKSGSSVIENLWTRDDYAIPRASVWSKDRGEAAVVDLGPRGLLFALLAKRAPNGSVGSSGDYAHYLPLEVFKRTGALKYSSHGQRGAMMAQLSTMRGAKAELTREEIPFLVRFRDINDPKTVEAVNPNDLAKSFGEGVRLKRATIEMTGDPVTTGIEKRLPAWFVEIRGKKASLDGDTSIARRIDGPLSNKIGSGLFERGF